MGREFLPKDKLDAIVDSAIRSVVKGREYRFERREPRLEYGRFFVLLDLYDNTYVGLAIPVNGAGGGLYKETYRKNPMLGFSRLIQKYSGGIQPARGYAKREDMGGSSQK